MEAKDVIAFRNQFDSATFTRWNKYTGEKKVFKPGIHICCDNSLNAFDDRMGSVIWDDENERFYWFKLNSEGSHPQSPTMAMSFGDKVLVPALVVAVDYGEIQNMRIIMDREMFDKYIEALGDLVSEDQKQHLIYELFDSLSMDYVIRRKNRTSYVTGENKDLPISSMNHDENDEYNKTIHT